MHVNACTHTLTHTYDHTDTHIKVKTNREPTTSSLTGHSLFSWHMPIKASVGI